ncbi:MAG: HAD-IA family hydrolase, partial [Lachnospiraceae bacterium]|nr:HAD-IA family hydrolase [Lachnospiraceae bacterium]
VLFDLDGTLLPMEQESFIKCYFKLLATKLASLGYAQETVVDSVWKGVGSMIKNDGSCLNEDAFWNTLSAIYGKDCTKDKGELHLFYEKEFNQVQKVCGKQPASREVIELVREKGLMAVLATNPLFPEVATRARMSWVNLVPEDFTYYTTYENSHYCKPNPKYYQEILEQTGLKAEECLMVGNDAHEDMVAAALGMQVFLLTDCLENSRQLDISAYPRGGFVELKKYIENI